MQHRAKQNLRISETFAHESLIWLSFIMNFVKSVRSLMSCFAELFKGKATQSQLLRVTINFLKGQNQQIIQQKIIFQPEGKLIDQFIPYLVPLNSVLDFHCSWYQIFIVVIKIKILNKAVRLYDSVIKYSNVFCKINKLKNLYMQITCLSSCVILLATVP